MPLVRLEVRQGRSATQKQALLDAAHAALVEALDIPDDDRMQRIVEHARDHFELPPGSSDDFVLVEVTMFAGRSRQAKRQLYQALVRNLGKLGVAPPTSSSCCRSRPWTTGVSAEAGWPARWTWVSRSKSDQPHHAPAR
jgi:5-carboxymethyl-2-hydroxymuconate isomerase